MYFAARPPQSYAEVMACDRESFNRFFHAMLERGRLSRTISLRGGVRFGRAYGGRYRADGGCGSPVFSADGERLAPESDAPVVGDRSLQTGDVLGHSSHLLVGHPGAMVRIMALGSLARSPLRKVATGRWCIRRAVPPAADTEPESLRRRGSGSRNRLVRRSRCRHRDRASVRRVRASRSFDGA